MKYIFDNIEPFFIKFYNDFQKYVFTNNILVLASAYSIGFATHNMILKILDLFEPFVLIIVAGFIHIDKSFIGVYKIPFLYKFIITIANILFNIIIWLLIIVLTFLFVEYILNINVVGLKTIVKEQEEKDFIISKTEAKKDTNTSIKENAKEIKIIDKKEEIIGEKIINEKNKVKLNELYTNVDDIDINDIYKISSHDIKYNPQNTIVEPFQNLRTNTSFTSF